MAKGEGEPGRETRFQTRPSLCLQKSQAKVQGQEQYLHSFIGGAANMSMSILYLSHP